ncbi:branched-chain amino acid ABC transporter permease [Halomicroarcula sp. F13]|uniref:Branched-chain amino acid ABC transporter permease n=1 Tax=Haloarcula rubra TaxID=2487747 RepID=A0AAW4PT01_9EURY|nr:branched-chain amino acid ABC transporter permease [Halomicroarcula rubra]MBX0324123.1 branched-chain amino acid ABC transporter permease [Halomicroarcula rubra]
MSLLSQILTILLNGLQQGAIYVLLAVGLSIILGTLKFVNFAHGALYLLGAYLGLFITTEVQLTNGMLPEWGITTFGLGLGFLAALLIVPLVTFVVGIVMERFVAKPFYDRPDTDQILVTFGLAVIFQEALRALIGGDSQSLPQPAWASGPIALPIIGNFPRWRLGVIVITALLVLFVYALVEYTDFGLIVRAGTMDSEMVRLLGIRLDRPYLVVFGIGAALAGIAGVVGGPLANVNPNIGTEQLVPAFLTVVIGGVGKIEGAVLAGLLLGTLQVLLIQTGFAAWNRVGIYVLAAVILLVRPQGLLGSEVDVE